MITTKQYIGPFAANDKIEITPNINRKVVAIGISCPDKFPNYIDKNTDPEIQIQTVDWVDSEPTVIKKQEYLINERGILEFDDLFETGVNIVFLKSFQENTVVSVSFSQMED